jgi:hypothetical protein
MANFNKRVPTQQERQQERPAPAPVQAPAPQSQPQEPAMEITSPIAVAAEGIAEMVKGGAPTSKENDDPEMQTHPRKDYQLASHAVRIGGKRELQGDILCRQLNCTMFEVEVYKDWGPNPLGGAPVPISYTRLFPEKQLLFDHFDVIPPEAIINMKRDLAHAHGYKYLHQYPSLPLTVQELDRQLKIEDAFFKNKK